MNKVRLRAGSATLADWRAIYRGACPSVEESCIPAVEASAKAVAEIIDRGKPVYGVNTGFGKLASERIEVPDLAKLQRNIVLSHAAGTGAPSPQPIVRLMMSLKLASLARGASGVSMQTLSMLDSMLTRGLTPVIPSQGTLRTLAADKFNFDIETIIAILIIVIVIALVAVVCACSVIRNKRRIAEQLEITKKIKEDSDIIAATEKRTDAYIIDPANDCESPNKN